MSARLYQVTVVIMRSGFTVAEVSEYLVAASTRQRAIKLAQGRCFTDYADNVSVTCECIAGASYRTNRRTLRLPEAL